MSAPLVLTLMPNQTKSRKARIPAILLLLLSFIVLSSEGRAQDKYKELGSTITAKDSAFWSAYNKCDVEATRPMFTSDVEFYHDKGGPIFGLESFMSALTNGLCGDPNSRLRREAVEGTVRVFPLENGGKIYGAMISGEHVFYVKQKDKAEFLDGRARFLQLWLLKDGVWKMSRILSYDHGPTSEKGGTKANQK